MMDEQDIGRILDELWEQGDKFEMSIWFWMHVCTVCPYFPKNKEKK